MNKADTTRGRNMFFASQLRYIGKGIVESTDADGNLIVRLADGRRGKVASDQVFTTKRAALDFARVPHQAGWSDAAQLLTATARVRS